MKTIISFIGAFLFITNLSFANSLESRVTNGETVLFQYGSLAALNIYGETARAMFESMYDAKTSEVEQGEYRKGKNVFCIKEFSTKPDGRKFDEYACNIMFADIMKGEIADQQE